MENQETTIDKILNTLMNSMNFIDVINLAKDNDEINLENVDYLKYCPEFIISHNDIKNFNDSGFSSENIHDLFSFTINSEPYTNPIKLFKNYENINNITFRDEFSERTYILKDGFKFNKDYDSSYATFESDAHNLKGTAIIEDYDGTLKETYCINGEELDKISFKDIIRKVKFTKILKSGHDVDYFMELYRDEKVEERIQNIRNIQKK